MKKILLAAILAAAMGIAQAQTVTSNSLAVTGSTSVSGVVGNGFGYSSQKSGAFAVNTSSASAQNVGGGILGGAAATSASSQGATGSFVAGVNVGSAFGASSAHGVQFGAGYGQAGGNNTNIPILKDGVGTYGATSEAAVGSASKSANINNGFAANTTKVGAQNASAGWSIDTSVGLFGGTSSTGGGTLGGTTSGSFSIQWGAIGATGGVATQDGAGGGTASF